MPLHTEFVTVPSKPNSKAPVSAIYEVIISYLTEASNRLPDQVTAPFLGKAAAKGAALSLLGKAYLTRAWLTDNNSDFQQAYTILTGLIDNQATYGLGLWEDYQHAFTIANDFGKENIFVFRMPTAFKLG